MTVERLASDVTVLGHETDRDGDERPGVPGDLCVGAVAGRGSVRDLRRQDEPRIDRGTGPAPGERRG